MNRIENDDEVGDLAKDWGEVKQSYLRRSG